MLHTTLILSRKSQKWSIGKHTHTHTHTHCEA